MKVAAIAMAMCLGAAGSAVSAVSMLELMKAEVDSAANAFWAGGNDPPEGETPEAAEARWRAAAQAAAKLEDYGRRLQSPEHTRSGGWNAFAAIMVEAGAAGRAAAEKRDIAAAFEVGGRLYEACDGCHKAYVPRRRG